MLTNGHLSEPRTASKVLVLQLPLLHKFGSTGRSFQLSDREALWIRQGGPCGRRDSIAPTNPHLPRRAFEIVAFNLPDFTIAAPAFPHHGCIIKNQVKYLAPPVLQGCHFYFSLLLCLSAPFTFVSRSPPAASKEHSLPITSPPRIATRHPPLGWPSLSGCAQCLLSGRQGLSQSRFVNQVPQF